MKVKKVLFYILMFLPLAVVLISLPFLPDQIPAHYGFDLQVTRWGSKYETLIFPAMTIALGAIMLVTAKYAAKHEENGSNNEKVCMDAGLAGMGVFAAMTVYFLYMDFHLVEDLTAIPWDVYQIIFGILGISMIIVGNIMPKLRMNSLLGLRTSWSMKNEETWKRSQRFGGIMFIVGGIATIVVCCFVKGLSCLLWAMGILAVLTIVCVCYTYKISKQFG